MEAARMGERATDHRSRPNASNPMVDGGVQGNVAAVFGAGRRRLAVFFLGLGIALQGPALGTESARLEVVVVQAAGSQVSPFADFTARFRRELIAQSTAPVQFFPISLEVLDIGSEQSESRFLEYMHTLFAGREIDLVVTVGTTAADFCIRHREEFLPGTPLLFTALADGAVEPQQNSAVAGMVDLDFRRMIEVGLEAVPATEVVSVVFGDSPRERELEKAMRREVAPLSGRVRFEWWSHLSLDEMVEKAAALPPGSMIFYGMLRLDARGFSFEGDSGLDRLAAASRAPVLGVFDYQLGRGILGGALFSLDELASESASAALRLVAGETPESVGVPASQPSPSFDWRQLARFRISESQLPPGSLVVFRPPSLWDEYRGPVLMGIGPVRSAGRDDRGPVRSGDRSTQGGAGGERPFAPAVDGS